jgi:hypothetical protein
VYSKRDKGTTFKIVFPLSNQDENIWFKINKFLVKKGLNSLFFDIKTLL